MADVFVSLAIAAVAAVVAIEGGRLLGRRIARKKNVNN